MKFLFYLVYIFLFLLVIREGIELKVDSLYLKKYTKQLPFLASLNSSGTFSKKKISFSQFEILGKRNLFGVKDKVFFINLKKKIKKKKVKKSNKNTLKKRKETVKTNSRKKKEKLFSLKGLELVGVIYSSDSNFKSWAIVEKRRKQKVFTLGDDIFGYGKLVSIYPKQVILEKNGKKYLLKLPEKRLILKKIKESHKKLRHSEKGSKLKISKVGNVILIKREKLFKYMKGGNSFLTDALIVPHYQDGVQRGWKIKRIKKGGIYDILGYKKGDILTAINGNSLNDPQVMMSAFDLIREGSGEFRVEILRDGRKKEFTYQITD